MMLEEPASSAPKNQIITFGCRLNSFESEAIKQAVENSGAKNLIIFNSCAVTAAAEKELRASIRKARKNNPNAKIVITGCAAQTNPQFYSKMPEVDLVLGNDLKTDAKNYLEIEPSQQNQYSNPNFLLGSSQQSSSQSISLIFQNSSSATSARVSHQNQLFYKANKDLNQNLTTQEHSKIRVNDIMSVKETAPQLVSYFENQTRAFLEIQNGCNHRCTFCIIPFGRGNSRSVPFGEIVETTKKLLAAGHQEVVLTGVDISDYGLDLPAPISLAQMIRRLFKLVPELPRLRLSSVDVAELGDDFFDILANEPRLMPYLHLSVQSGDDLILKRMARRHNRTQIVNFCEKARKIRPEITFGADLIAGFPTENDEMFENSLRLISEADLIFTHIFPYSKRIGTPAAKMPQIDSKIIKTRARKLREAGENQQTEFLKKQIGKEMAVLFERDNKGKSENFLDVEIANLGEGKVESGKILRVKIEDWQERKLIGKVCDQK